MKKITLAILAIMCAASFSFAENWGLGLKLGAGQNDPKTLNDLHTSGELDEGNGFFAIEGQYEWELKEANKIGLRFGVDAYGDNELKVGPIKITETTYALPLTVYYKYDKGIQHVNCYVGGGATYIRSDVEEGTFKDHKAKVFPHIVAGAEYRFNALFGLGVEAKYNISAELKKGDYKTDRSGFMGALVARFYF